MKTLDKYEIEAKGVKHLVEVFDTKPVNSYKVSMHRFSANTEKVLHQIKSTVINQISFEISKQEKLQKKDLEDKFREKIRNLVNVAFDDLATELKEELISHIFITSLGLGEVEFLLADDNLEEVVINGANKPLWVYHKHFAWLKTNIIIEDEGTIRHYATIIGKDVNRDINDLNPLMDAHLKSGDRVNATLSAVTPEGHTLTIRKFAKVPWTITTFLKNKTIDYLAAAYIWQAIEYEQSFFVVGGTGSGKTSALNVFSNFLPPNQRILTIEDTRELMLPKTLHWVPMETRLPNPEGKGEISMLQLLVNSLRMRPDRIVVGEVREKSQAEVLLEAIRTGHSGYATFHANTANEAVQRLSSPPMNIPKFTIADVGLMIVQNRNRRTGQRRTFQLAEINSDGNVNVFLQYNVAKEIMEKKSESSVFNERLKLFSGLDDAGIKSDIDDKISVLKWLVKKDIKGVDDIGAFIAEYYTDKTTLLNKVNATKNMNSGSEMKR